MHTLLNRRFVVLLLSVFSAGIFTAPVNALLPAYIERLHYSTSLTGALGATSMAVAAVLFLVGGALADWLGYKRTLLLGLIVSCVCGLIFLLSAPLFLFGTSALIGVGFALESVGSQSYLLGAIPAKRLGIGAALFFVGYTLSSSLGSLIFGLVADAWGDQAMGCLIFVGLAVSAVATAVVLPNVPLPGAESRHTLMQTLRGYHRLLTRPQVRLLLAIRFLPTCMWGAALLTFSYLIYVETGTYSGPAFYNCVSLFIAACAQIFTGQFCDRFGLRVPIRVASISLLICALLTAVFAGSLLGLWIFGIAMTSSAWSLSTTMPALMNRVSSAGDKGRIVGAAHVAWGLGMAVGQLGAGWLIKFEPSACYYVGSLFCAGTVVCAWRITLGEYR